MPNNTNRRSSRRATVVSAESLAPKRILPELYREAKQLEALLADQTLPPDVRAQIEQAVLDSAEAMNVSVFHPALVRLAFIEIMRQSAANQAARKPGTWTHLYESPVIRLLTAIEHGQHGNAISLQDEIDACDEISIAFGEKATGMEERSLVALTSFIKRAKCREICSEAVAA
jgi:hypothetical protein